MAARVKKPTYFREADRRTGEKIQIRCDEALAARVHELSKEREIPLADILAAGVDAIQKLKPDEMLFVRDGRVFIAKRPAR